MLKLAPVIRIGLTLFGALLVVGAFAGVLMLGVGTNPPPLYIAVASRDLAQGEQVQPGDYRIVEQIIDPRLAALYVQESELPKYHGAFVVDTMRRGDPLNKIKLSIGDDGIVLRRYALALVNPDDVVMTLPVNPDIIPQRIAQGDFVNILFAGGEGMGLDRLPNPTVVPALPAPMSLDAAATPEPMPTIAISETTSEIVLLLADLMLEHVPVLDVVYEQTQRASYDGNPSTDQAPPPTINGPIKAIVVRVPRSHQTLLMFGASMSKLRFAIGSPRLAAGSVQPQMGMDWGKYVSLYRWKEAQVAARGETLTQTLYPQAQVIVVAPTTPPIATPIPPTATPPAAN